MKIDDDGDSERLLILLIMEPDRDEMIWLLMELGTDDMILLVKPKEKVSPEATDCAVADALTRVLLDNPLAEGRRTEEARDETEVIDSVPEDSKAEVADSTELGREEVRSNDLRLDDKAPGDITSEEILADERLPDEIVAAEIDPEKAILETMDSEGIADEVYSEETILEETVPVADSTPEVARDANAREEVKSEGIVSEERTTDDSDKIALLKIAVWLLLSSVVD